MSRSYQNFIARRATLLGERRIGTSVHYGAAAAAALSLVFTWLQLRFGFDVGDEGFLWYGVQRVLAGETPIRDFQAYDPARYFWSAGWMRLAGDDGLVALRWSNGVLAAITVAIAAIIVRGRDPRQGFWETAAIGAIFAIWMAPGYKVSDSFALLVLLLGATRLIPSPSPRRYFQAGICWGVAAMIGINHALYGAIAGLIILICLWRQHSFSSSSLVATMAGVFAGYSPVLLLHILIPGFTSAYIDSVMLLFDYGTTNVSLPFPDLLSLVNAPDGRRLHGLRQSLFAVTWIAAILLWGTSLLKLRNASDAFRQPIILSGLVLALPYAHYVHSRADIFHLAISILPVLAFALPMVLNAAARWRIVLLPAIAALSLALTASLHPAYLPVTTSGVSVQVGDERLMLDPTTAQLVQAARAIADDRPTGTFFAGPYTPGLYAATRRKSPIWEIYMLFPLPRERQEAELARLEAARIRYAVIGERQLDGRPDLGLRNTHPLIFAYLQRCLPHSTAIRVDFRIAYRGNGGAACPRGRMAAAARLPGITISGAPPPVDR